MQQQSKFLNQILQTCLRLLQQQQQKQQQQLLLPVTKTIVTTTTAAAKTTTKTTTTRISKNLWQLLYRDYSAVATCETTTPIPLQRAAQLPSPPSPTQPPPPQSTIPKAQIPTVQHWRNSFLSNSFLPSTHQKTARTYSSSAVAIICAQPMVAARTYSKFTSSRDPPFGGVTPLCEDRANDLISNLKDSEREAIKLALAKYDAMKQKEGFEGKLAATQWRTRFGRLTKVPALGDVDPTGTFCAFPADWLKKKAAEKAIEPSSSDLVKIFFVNAVPFVAFGFLDNFTMIIAGDYIEILFGTFMCISTMAAAGLGNTISDILGIGSAYYVERGCELMGLKPPDLTPVQMEMKSSRRSANYGRMIGITVGCLVGMVPLLFMEKKERKDDANTECASAKGKNASTTAAKSQ